VAAIAIVAISEELLFRALALAFMALSLLEPLDAAAPILFTRVNLSEEQEN
jgi:membrane protease YdiL (CAAX protease family)